MNTDMAGTLERVYSAYKRRTPSHIDACPCCLDDKDMEGLLGQPLRQVKSGYLFSYLGSVFYTVGTVSDFKYFLPRILELAAGEDAFHVEIVFKKLRMAEWDNGLKEEVASIEAFVEAWFLQTVAAAEDTLDVWPLDGLICGIALAGFDLEPYFQCLLAHPLVLMAWYEMNPDVQDGVLSNSFWDGSEAQMQPVLAFMASPAVQGTYQIVATGLTNLPLVR